MQQLARELGGQLQWLQAGLPRFAPLPMTQTLTANQSQDLGLWLLLPLLPLALLARVGTLWLLLLGTGFGILNPQPLQAAPTTSLSVQESQAWQAYQQGRYLAAARDFKDPLWRGNAWYRAGDYAQAAAAYASATSATAHYNRGNALVQLGNLVAAEQAYLAALAKESNHEDARYNLALLRAQPPQATPQAQDPDPIDAPEQAASPDSQLPSPPVLLLEQRLRKRLSAVSCSRQNGARSTKEKSLGKERASSSLLAPLLAAALAVCTSSAGSTATGRAAAGCGQPRLVAYRRSGR